MKSFKRIFFFQLKFLPLLAAIVFIIGAIVYESIKKSPDDYKVISKREFFKKAIENEITDFEKVDRYIQMEVNEIEKYQWKTKNYNEQYELRDSIMNYNNSFSIGESSSNEEESYYMLGVFVIILYYFLILVFNLTVVLWFFCFYDLMKSEFVENHNKYLWLICLILLPLISPVFYWAIAFKQKRA